MFIRGKHPEAVIWRHFRSSEDYFVFGRGDGCYEARVGLNADRAIDLFAALIEQMPPACSVAIDDWRTGITYEGEDLANSDVRDAIARSGNALARAAGLEISVYTDEEQLTLSANLELFLFARTDRWLYLLEGKGLRRVVRLRPRSWRLSRGEFAPSEPLARELRALVDRLQLTTMPA